MLTAAALGMFSYGVYSAGWAAADLIRGARRELWAELGLIVFGALLVLAAAFVRVRLPGGLAFAIGALLGLQALAVHDAVHLQTGVTPQIIRAAVAIRSCWSRWLLPHALNAKPAKPAKTPSSLRALRSLR